ncbi:MAG: ABC transporter permease [Candidatus Omnitrophota bacterium]|nr:ABC transporter permease [Candidatus Omnitrophota bacterium]
MFLFKLAFLNITRNVRRSLITVMAVGVGLAALIFLWGFNDGTIEQMRENVIRLFTGHVQIHARGFEKSLSPELFLAQREKVLIDVAANPAVSRITERVKCEALVGTSENSRGVLLVGVDPERERQITDLEDHIEAGRYLEPDGNREILVGDRLAKKIGLDLDDKVVVMTQAMDGTLAGYAYRVKGIFHTGSQQIDEVSVYITLASAQELLGLGEDVHEIVIQLSDRKGIEPFLEWAKISLGSEKYEVLKWNELIPEVDQWTQWAEAVIGTILIAVMVVIGVSIMNTVLMSIYERTRELGVMMAIGTSPSQIVQLILLETLILEGLGIILGLVGGYLVTIYFGEVGISFHGVEEAFSRSYMSTVVFTKVEWPHVVQSVITLILLTSFIGLYPAWKASRMEPVKAIYYS